MAVNQVTTAQLTQQVQAFMVEMNVLFNRIQLWAAIVISIGTTALQAAPYNMTSGDATDLFNAAQDLNNFSKVFTGAGYVTLGITVNSGTYHDNGVASFGYPFSLNPGKCDGLGY